MGIGRPSKLTPELEKKILDLVAEGNFLSTAALACGVDPRTYRVWKQKGKEGKKPYAAFFDRAVSAEARGETAMVALLKFAALGFRRVVDPTTKELVVEEFKGDPKPVEWILERRIGRRWGNKLRIELDRSIEEMMRALQSQLDPETFRRVVEAVANSSDRSEDPDGLAGEFDGVD